MRKMTARQKQILILLLGRKNGMTAAEIAAEINVSVRTVHRELDEIEKILANFGLLLHRKSGTGISVWSNAAGSEEGKKLQEARRLLLVDKPSDYSGEERQLLLICRLLEEQEPCKLFTLANGLKVTVATISSDLDEVEPWARRFGLELVRRRGYGVELIGDEQGKRAALCQLAADHLDYSDLIGGSPVSQVSSATAKLLEVVGTHNLMTVENTLWAMNWNWTEHLSENAYTQLLIHLSVSVNRIHVGRFVGAVQGKPISTGAGGERDEGETSRFALRLADQLTLTFPPEEIAYMNGLFNRAKEASPELVQADLELVDTVYRLTENVVKRTGIPFQEDRLLRSGLLEHMGPAFKRIREGSRIRNPLLSAIRKDYEELFGIVREAMNDSAAGLEVPDEEIGFLVMHFGASIERLNQLGRNVRAILVCSSGLSSSKLLATRLAKEMPQIEVLGNVSWYEAKRLPESDYDLIISTIDLPLPEDRYVRLSPLLTEEDSEQLLAYVQHTTLRSRKPAPEPESAKTRAFDKVRSLSMALNEVVSLLDQFDVRVLNNRGDSLRGTVTAALEEMNQSFVPPSVSDVAAVTDRLLEREKMASQVIPGTSLALFHTRTRFVNYRSLALFRLEEPVLLDGGTKVGALLFMLAPRELSRESLEVLSEISALLLKPELVELLETGERPEIRNFLATELLVYFENL
ncbi:BglG family transcription antiterminator [Paenibacillus sp. MBLB2552]|uniref:BglG family transcription antiterminator n=1 Tax=Paenibacillus mellifer TaxID=2937794 RepID=A0A9X2BSM0_9BACL|nr:BglG family transcription antiterminator [Paenibacillus mellifer]MCK8488570.1 BglG family transcription antiterminator [Paenibacillus mellifer]